MKHANLSLPAPIRLLVSSTIRISSYLAHSPAYSIPVFFHVRVCVSDFGSERETFFVIHRVSVSPFTVCGHDGYNKIKAMSTKISFPFWNVGRSSPNKKKKHRNLFSIFLPLELLCVSSKNKKKKRSIEIGSFLNDSLSLVDYATSWSFDILPPINMAVETIRKEPF